MDIAFDVFFQARPIVFPAGQLSCLVNAKMPCKRIIVVTTYNLVADDFWDIWEPSILEHSFNFFPAFRKASSSHRFCLFVVVLQLGEPQTYGTNVDSVRALSTQFGSERIPELT